MVNGRPMVEQAARISVLPSPFFGRVRHGIGSPSAQVGGEQCQRLLEQSLALRHPHLRSHVVGVRSAQCAVARRWDSLTLVPCASQTRPQELFEAYCAVVPGDYCEYLDNVATTLRAAQTTAARAPAVPPAAAPAPATLPAPAPAASAPAAAPRPPTPTALAAAATVATDAQPAAEAGEAATGAPSPAPAAPELPPLPVRRRQPREALGRMDIVESDAAPEPPVGFSLEAVLVQLPFVMQVPPVRRAAARLPGLACALTRERAVLPQVETEEEKEAKERRKKESGEARAAPPPWRGSSPAARPR